MISFAAAYKFSHIAFCEFTESNNESVNSSPIVSHQPETKMFYMVTWILCETILRNNIKYYSIEPMNKQTILHFFKYLFFLEF